MGGRRQPTCFEALVGEALVGEALVGGGHLVY